MDATIKADLSALADTGELHAIKLQLGLTERELAEHYGITRDGTFGRLCRRARGKYEATGGTRSPASFGNTGPEYERFTNEMDVDELREWYVDLTDHKERALDIDVLLDAAPYYNCVLASDVHLGPRECAYSKWRKLLGWILDTPDTGLMINGDLFNLNTVTGPGSPALDKLDFDGQQRIMYADLEPLARAGKCKGLLTGNHDDRLRRAAGVKENPVMRLAKELDVPYLGYEGFVRWRIQYEDRTQVYTGYHHHGMTGATTSGGVIQALERLASRNRADYVTMGHTHGLRSDVSTYRYVDDAGEILTGKTPIVNSGSYQRTQGGTYAADKAYSPALVGSASVFLHGDKHSVHART